MENRINLRNLKREILNDLEAGSVNIAKNKIRNIPKKQQHLKDFLDSINIERISGVASREQSTNRFKKIKWGKSPKKTKKRKNKKTKRHRKKTKTRKRK